MSFIDTHLLPGESVVYRTRLHWKLFVIPVLLTLIFLAAGIWMLSQQRQPLAMAAGVLAIVVLIPPWLRRRSSEFAVTSKRVIIKLGFTTTRSMELLLSKIEGITVTQSFAGRIFGYGEILVTGSGGTHEPFDNIQSPLEFRQAVQVATTSGPPSGD
jgi:uncharacterized membrane protein YdbT with pleckstrin-like domain